MNEHIPDRRIPEFGASQGAFRERRTVTVATVVLFGLAIAHHASPLVAHVLNTLALVLGAVLALAAVTWVVRLIQAGRYTPADHAGQKGRPPVGVR